MGLAEPKSRQRIYADPRNTHWSNDKSKFGYKMLEKMGWQAGKGLGLNENGQTEHVKISLKQDQLGVGADKKTGDNWLAHTDAFNDLLASLNGNVGSGSDEKEKQQEGVVILGTESATKSTTARVQSHGRLAHRSKFLKAKMMATSSTDHLKHILGVSKKTAQDDTIPSENNTEKSTDIENATEQPNRQHQTVTVSKVSTHDYFQARMAAMGLLIPSSKSSSKKSAVTVQREVENDWQDRMRVGLGAEGTAMGLGFSPSSTANSEAGPSSDSEAAIVEDETMKPLKAKKKKKRTRQDCDSDIDTSSKKNKKAKKHKSKSSSSSSSSGKSKKHKKKRS